MIRVLHLINDLTVGGAQRMLVNIVDRMCAGRFETRVVTLLSGGFFTRELERRGIEVVGLNMRRGVPDPRALLRFRSGIRKWRPDILQTWLHHSNLFGLLASVGTPVGHVVWNLRGVVAGGCTARICAKLSRYPSAVVVNSHAGRQAHTGIGFRPRRWEVLPNGFDLDRYAARPGARATLVSELGSRESDVLAGTFARWHRVKGHDVLLDALARTPPSLRLVLAGTGMDENNAELRSHLRGVAHRVHLLGERHDIEHLAAAVDLVVSASRSEGLPNALGEAMASATPCVSTAAGGSAEIVGDTGLLVPVGDADALGTAMTRLACLPARERRAMGHRARMRMESQFELGRAARRYEELYRELAGA